jgi:structural maintenance of chromosome 1
LDDVEAKLADTEKEADKARKDSKTARDQFNDVKRRRLAHLFLSWWLAADICHGSCEMFNKAYTHISERIDQVYKDLTKGKASPMGGVAYLSLEDSEVCAKNPIVLRSDRIFNSRNHMLVESSITPCLP